MIHASFQQRRKTLVNGLNHAPDIHVPKEAFEEALKKMELSPGIRGEAMTLAQFAELANRTWKLQQAL